MKKRILVVEDDENIRSGLLDALEAEGHEPEGAADGSGDRKTATKEKATKGDGAVDADYEVVN